VRSAAIVALLVWLIALPAAAKDLAITGAKVYPSPTVAAIENATVVVHDGRIVAVGPAGKIRVPRGAEVIDGRGLIVTAGFWNSHVHLMSPAIRMGAKAPAAALSGEMEAMLTRWGFTSVFDIASAPGDAIALRRRIAAGEVTGPMILTVDGPFYPKDGTPIYVRDVAVGMPSMEVATPAEGAARARRQLASGADGVKLFAGAIVGPPVGVLPMPVDVATAVVAEAHKAGKPAFAHPTNNIGLDVAIRSGVDILAHPTPDGGPWPAGTIERLRAGKMALIPTLTLWRVELAKDNAPQAVIDRFIRGGQQQVKAYSDAGGQILFGTDVGYTDAFDTTEEYRYMAGAGLDYRAILASLTTAPASRYKFPRKGSIASGQDGDLVILSADPAQDPTAFAKVSYTIRDGRVIYRAGR
jgi:imidazolonepropionase-like amidohydrolase